MKLGKKNAILVSFMLFSMFFGAGNLIFPPFLGQSAGSSTLWAMLGFLLTAVLLPVLGVAAVAKFDGLDNLGRQVGNTYGLVFILLCYLAIGPGLAIPRAASVPFEMAFSPYLPENANVSLWMAGYSVVFFLAVLWLCMTPGKLVQRFGEILTPCLLIMMAVLFVGFLFRGSKALADAVGTYSDNPFLTGFSEGYNTMDAIAALIFGLVVATSLENMGFTEKKDIVRSTILTGILAGVILALVYVMLGYMGMYSSGVYTNVENGAQILRAVAEEVFGTPGAVLLAAIFTLACLTTCVGLTNSFAQYFSKLIPQLSYKQWVYVVLAFSLLVSNLGLNTILSVSVPVLNAIYPVCIVLILLGLSHGLWKNSRFVYPITVGGTTVVSVTYALSLPALNELFARLLPLYDLGYGWCSVAVVCLAVSLVLDKLIRK